MSDILFYRFRPHSFDKRCLLRFGRDREENIKLKPVRYGDGRFDYLGIHRRQLVTIFCRMYRIVYESPLSKSSIDKPHRRAIGFDRFMLKHTGCQSRPYHNWRSKYTFDTWL